MGFKDMEGACLTNWRCMQLSKGIREVYSGTTVEGTSREVRSSGNFLEVSRAQVAGTPLALVCPIPEVCCPSRQPRAGQPRWWHHQLPTLKQ